MGIQDRDYYWKDREIDAANQQPSGRRFRVIDEVRYPSSEPVESHSPERTLGVLTVVSALIVVAFISYQAQVDRAEKQAQQKAAEHAIQASVAKAADVKARAVAQADEQARVHADQLEQKRRLLEKLNKDAEKKRQRDAAWDSFYQPSFQCKSDWTVECANVLIRARAAFSVQHGD